MLILGSCLICPAECLPSPWAWRPSPLSLFTTGPHGAPAAGSAVPSPASMCTCAHLLTFPKHSSLSCWYFGPSAFPPVFELPVIPHTLVGLWGFLKAHTCIFLYLSNLCTGDNVFGRFSSPIPRCFGNDGCVWVRLKLPAAFRNHGASEDHGFDTCILLSSVYGHRKTKSSNKEF